MAENLDYDNNLSGIKRLSSTQLEKIVKDLKSTKNSADISSILHFLQRFCVGLGTDASTQVLESDIVKFVSSLIKTHEETSVRVSAIAFLVVLSLSSGKYNEQLGSNVSLLMLLNLLNEESSPICFEIVDSIGIQLSTPSSASAPQAIEATVAMISKLIAILRSEKTDDTLLEKVTDILTDTLESDFMCVFLKPSSSPSSPSSSPSSRSSFSSSAPPSSQPASNVPPFAVRRSPSAHWTKAREAAPQPGRTAGDCGQSARRGADGVVQEGDRRGGETERNRDGGKSQREGESTAGQEGIESYLVEFPQIVLGYFVC